MVRICAVGDPHGDMGKIGKVAKNVDFYLVTGDLGKADLARKIYFENFDRKRKGLPEKELNKKEKKEIHDEIHNSTMAVLTHLAKRTFVYSI